MRDDIEIIRDLCEIDEISHADKVGIILDTLIFEEVPSLANIGERLRNLSSIKKIISSVFTGEELEDINRGLAMISQVLFLCENLARANREKCRPSTKRPIILMNHHNSIAHYEILRHKIFGVNGYNNLVVEMSPCNKTGVENVLSADKINPISSLNIYNKKLGGLSNNAYRPVYELLRGNPEFLYHGLTQQAAHKRKDCVVSGKDGLAGLANTYLMSAFLHSYSIFEGMHSVNEEELYSSITQLKPLYHQWLRRGSRIYLSDIRDNDYQYKHEKKNVIYKQLRDMAFTLSLALNSIDNTNIFDGQRLIFHDYTKNLKSNNSGAILVVGAAHTPGILRLYKKLFPSMPQPIAVYPRGESVSLDSDYIYASSLHINKGLWQTADVEMKPFSEQYLPIDVLCDQAKYLGISVLNQVMQFPDAELNLSMFKFNSALSSRVRQLPTNLRFDFVYREHRYQQTVLAEKYVYDRKSVIKAMFEGLHNLAVQNRALADGDVCMVRISEGGNLIAISDLTRPLAALRNRLSEVPRSIVDTTESTTKSMMLRLRKSTSLDFRVIHFGALNNKQIVYAPCDYHTPTKSYRL
ncbi:MAG: hypothetical protein HON32_07135 [Francisellaceae bacterium]|jgi:hypothetical protein|nr:hypothetical protein [Francisellaceae bacterium]